MKNKSKRHKGYAKVHADRLGRAPSFEENTHFTNVYNELRGLCEFIGKEKPEKIKIKIGKNVTEVDTEQSLKNYILIRLVNVAESQLQTIVTDLIDSLQLTPADVLRKDDISISINDLNVLRQDEITTGKIVTQAFDLKANINGIRRIFSNMTGLKFFEWHDELGLFDEEDFKEILVKRNDVVHNLHDVEWNHEQLEKRIGRVQSYASLFHITAWLYLDENPKHEKALEKSCQEYLGINLVRFRKDANKFKFKS